MGLSSVWQGPRHMSHLPLPSLQEQAAGCEMEQPGPASAGIWDASIMVLGLTLLGMTQVLAELLGIKSRATMITITDATGPCQLEEYGQSN